MKVPNNGTNIKVLSQNGTSMKIKVYKTVTLRKPATAQR